MAVCLETGEAEAELLWTISCSPHVNPETGEKEKRGGPAFRVPNLNRSVPPPPSKRKESNSKCCGGTYVITLAIVTLMMFAPSYGITLWLGIEVLYHVYCHKRPGLYQHPLHVFFFGEFCAYCQSKKRMNKVQKLQDRRYRRYVANIANIPVGT